MRVFHTPDVPQAPPASYGYFVLRYAMTRRWIPWHLLCLVVIAALTTLGVWQMSVAMAPETPGGPTVWHLRNVVYALQWWAFVWFAVWFWWRFMRDQRDADLAAIADSAEPFPDGVPALEIPEPQISLDAPAADRIRRSTLPRGADDAAG